MSPLSAMTRSSHTCSHSDYCEYFPWPRLLCLVWKRRSTQKGSGTNSSESDLSQVHPHWPSDDTCDFLFLNVIHIKRRKVLTDLREKVHRSPAPCRAQFEKHRFVAWTLPCSVRRTWPDSHQDELSVAVPIRASSWALCSSWHTGPLIGHQMPGPWGHFV